MSVEVVTRDDGDRYVVDGNPDIGYFIHRVGKPVARYDRKYEARLAILDGELEVLS